MLKPVRTVRATSLAHVRREDKAEQHLHSHLLRTAELAGTFAGKVGLPCCGRLLGLLHDLGKYSDAFQRYLASSAGLLDQDHDDFLPDAAAHKGKIDHSTAGGQYVYSRLKQLGPKGLLLGRMLALPMASHHSGLINSLDEDGADVFTRRMSKPEAQAHLLESFQRMDQEIASELEKLFAAEEGVAKELSVRQARLQQKNSANSAAFHHGQLVRFLLSCLVDADRIDSACFEFPEQQATYIAKPGPDWAVLRARLEEELTSKDRVTEVNALRRDIADHCLARADDAPGFFSLTVPTGGGKTLSSLRFALRHAQRYGLEHIFYIIPYTSIIDQNAETARRILETGLPPGSVVLEHHSNILPEKETWQGKLLAQNWDVPIIFTTMAQFLETLFGSGTSKARRMHNLARSVLVFDEIQTLPPRLTYLFCNALNFLVEECGSTALLCTATQPLLGRPPKPEKGRLALSPECEIVPNPAELFTALRRVNFIDHTTKTMTLEEIGSLALDELEQSRSCLVVVNTKKWAESIYRSCRERGVKHAFYLSTALCPAHRMDLLGEIARRLEAGSPVLCVSTQLIECGVDISFGSAIRFAAGLDSILQTAGRCNRHKEREHGRVHIVRPPEGEENLKHLSDIAAGKSACLHVLGEFAAMPAAGRDLSDPELVERYFEYYFYSRAKDMEYDVPADTIGRDDTLLSLLGSNERNIGKNGAPAMLRQSFATAASCFQPIDSAGRGMIVPYGEGREIIADLCSTPGRHDLRNLLRRAQRYTVNVFPWQLEKLQKQKAVRGVAGLEDVLCLDERWYDKELGLLEEGSAGLSTQVL